jgi:ankyrin repeat protein
MGLLEAKDAKGQTPLHLASHHHGGAEFLKEMTKILNSEQLVDFLKMADNGNNTPLHLVIEFEMGLTSYGKLAENRSSSEALRAVAEKLSGDQLFELLQMPGQRGQKLLHAIGGCANGAEFLKEMAEKLNPGQLIDLLKMTNPNNNTLLHGISQLKNSEVLSEFLKVVTDKLPPEELFNLLKTKNLLNNMPLHFAAQSPGGGVFLEAMIKSGKLSLEQLETLWAATNKKGKTPLNIALESPGGRAFLEVIVKNLPKEQLVHFLAMKSGNDNTLLHNVANFPKRGIFLRAIIESGKLSPEQLKAFLTATNKDGKTPIDFALDPNGMNTGVLKEIGKFSSEWLMEILTTPDKDGKTYFAKAMDAREEVAFLLALDSALPKEQLVNFLKTPDPSSGITPLHLAAQSGNKQLLDAVFMILKRYPEETIDLFQTKANGQTPMEIANETVKQDLEKALAEAQRRRDHPPQASMDLAAALTEIRMTPGFVDCSPEQQTYIIDYATQMIEGGDKLEFAIAVCASMAKLYQEKIDELMPDEIDVFKTYDPGVASGRIDQAMRTQITGKLREIMHANDADYKIISDYIRDQQQSATNMQSRAMKFFLFMQMEKTAAQIESEHYLGTGRDGPKTIEKLEHTFNKVCASGGISPDTYARSVAMYKAFIAIALKKVDFAGNDRDHNTCTVYRGIDRTTLEKSCPNYDTIKVGNEVQGLKHNSLESTSVERPIAIFNGAGTDTHMIRVSYSDIYVAFFMSPEMCAHKYGQEMELLCNLQRAETILKKRN